MWGVRTEEIQERRKEIRKGKSGGNRQTAGR
jgi:hypothetical protein